MRNIIRWIISYLSRYDKMHEDEIVLSLILNTSSLHLLKNEYVEFAAIKGTCGTFKLSGNALPVFTYTVFEKKIMEFIEVRVEISKPDRIHFESRIMSSDPSQNGKEVETTDKYKAPFRELTSHLTRYFPFPIEGGRKRTLTLTTLRKDATNEPTQEIQIQDRTSP